MKLAVPRVYNAPHGVKPQPPKFVAKPEPGFRRASKRHPGRIRPHRRVRNPPIRLPLQQTWEENGGPPDRYRTARCRNPNTTDFLLNPNLAFVEPAPPGEDKM